MEPTCGTERWVIVSTKARHPYNETGQHSGDTSSARFNVVADPHLYLQSLVFSKGVEGTDAGYSLTLILGLQWLAKGEKKYGFSAYMPTPHTGQLRGASKTPNVLES